MAETRTYDPSAGDPISDAIRAALGQTARPATPDITPEPTVDAPPTNITTIGTYTFTKATPPPDPTA